ncbi:hypothetical protein E3P77_03669 [Wallemia ichthyophaga]|nr:hypothetical protein E3P77_03669 [Wallemia ichthyophaga]
MPSLETAKVDLIVVYKLSSSDAHLKALHQLQSSFSWAVRPGSNDDEVLAFLQAKQSTRRSVDSECNNLYDYFMVHYASPDVKKVVIPHNHDFNKTLISDLTSSYLLSNQQLTSIKNAFGVNVGFYFAFLRSYFRSLILPSLIGFFCWFRSSQFSSFYAIFVSLYAVAFVEYWRVAERALSVQWGSDGSKSIELTRVERERTAWYVRESKLLATLPVLALFAMLLAALLTIIFFIEEFGLQFYNGPLKSYISLILSAVCSVIVPLLITAYQPVLNKLSRWENHATHSDTEASLTIKSFTLNSLVSFAGLALTAYVYIPFGKDLVKAASKRFEKFEIFGTNEIVEIDGSRIQTQLFAQMVTSQAIGTFQEVGLPYIMSFVRSHISKNTYTPKDAPEERDYLQDVREEVAKDTYDLFEDYAEMVTQFGFISLWSVAWPLAPLMGLINNFFEIRGDAFKLIKHYSRCIPRPTDSIGPWLDALSFLSWLSAMINTSLVILFNTSFKNSGILAAHGGVLVAFVAALVASHGHFVIKGIFARLFKIAIWDNSASAAIIIQAMSNENFAAIESRKRRRRTTPQELQLLEEEYLRNPLPSASKRAEIAQNVGMSSRNVQVWYQNKRQNEKRRQFNNNENEPLTFVETSFDSGSKVKRTTNLFKSKSTIKQSPKIAEAEADADATNSAQPLTSYSKQVDHVVQKVPPSPVETLPKDVKPRGRVAMNLNSLLCAPSSPQAKKRGVWP